MAVKQQKEVLAQQKETQKMLDALKKGDKIITIGGIHGTISSVHENTVIVKVDDNCKIEFNRSAISSVVKSEADKAKSVEEKANKKEKKSEDKVEETTESKE